MQLEQTAHAEVTLDLLGVGQTLAARTHEVVVCFLQTVQAAFAERVVTRQDDRVLVDL